MNKSSLHHHTKKRRMRILQVIHQFPPYSSQGSETYCLELSKSLINAGDSVAVFHISKTKPRRPKRVDEGQIDGVKTYHCIETGEYGRLANWSNPYLQSSFRNVLKIFRPDVVHFHNFLSLADDLIGMAKTMGVAVVYTLHDYGLICPNALLLREDMTLCEKNSPDFFDVCCPAMVRISHGNRSKFAANVPPLARLRLFANNQPNPIQRKLLTTAVAVAQALHGKPETTLVAEKKAFFLSATQRIFRTVDCFIAPSAFLRDRFVACGLPNERILHIRCGIRHFSRVTRALHNDHRLHFGYIGAFHPHKGIDLLLQAFNGLDKQATLHLHGCSFDTPVSDAYFQRCISDQIDGVELHGRYTNKEVATILSGLDAVIVPSRWYENSPLTIQEAQFAGVPVITANAGGMAELVRDGIDGRLFRYNDSEDLRVVLSDLIANPDHLQRYQSNAPEVPCIAEQSERIRQVYTDLI